MDFMDGFGVCVDENGRIRNERRDRVGIEYEERHLGFTDI